VPKLAKEEEVIAVIRHLGTQSVRSRRLILLSRAYLQDPPSIYDLRSSKSTKISSPSTPLRTTTAYPATPISHLPGTGRYALDSYRIFCTQKHDLNSEEWKVVLPTDKELVRYLVSQNCASEVLVLTLLQRWKWAYCESKAWSPTEGVLGDADAPYLTALIHELESSTP
jgi:methyl-CpG-binding domain protein 4